jgi:hypothetical protein
LRLNIPGLRAFCHRARWPGSLAVCTSPEIEIDACNAQSYLRPGAVERIFGRVLGWLIWIGLVHGHF